MSNDEIHGMQQQTRLSLMKQKNNQFLSKMSICLKVHSKKISNKGLQHNIPCVPTGSLIRPRRPRLV